MAQTFSDISFIGARSLGLVGTEVSNPEYSKSVFYNPAGLSLEKKLSIYCGSTSLYELKFLKHSYGSITIPSEIGNFAISMQELKVTHDDSSYKLSSERQVSLSQGFDLLKDNNSTLSIGYNLNYMTTYQAQSAGGSGNGFNGLPSKEINSYGIDVGIHSTLRNKFNFGAFVKNINSPYVGRGPSLTHYPRRMNLGIGYTPNKFLSTNFVLERVFGDKESSFRFGFEYNTSQIFTLRSGIQMNPNRFGIGFSIKLKIIEVSYGMLTHYVLDTTNAIDIKVSFE